MKPSTSAPVAPHIEDAERIVGPIVGHVRVHPREISVGEPLVVDIEATAVGAPLPVYVGGDQRNAAYYPMRVAAKMIDASGKVVCDTAERTEIPGFGGIGGERTFAVGETFHETAVLNPMCAALSVPGEYRITIHRRLSRASMHTTAPDSSVPLSCDIYPVHEGPLPAGYPAACASQMAALPSLTLEAHVRVVPFDAARVRRETKARLDEASDPIARERIAAWITGWVVCSGLHPPTGSTPPAAIVSALPSALPSSFPKPCP